MPIVNILEIKQSGDLQRIDIANEYPSLYVLVKNTKDGFWNTKSIRVEPRLIIVP